MKRGTLSANRIPFSNSPSCFEKNHSLSMPALRLQMILITDRLEKIGLKEILNQRNCS